MSYPSNKLKPFLGTRLDWLLFFEAFCNRAKKFCPTITLWGLLPFLFPVGHHYLTTLPVPGPAYPGNSPDFDPNMDPLDIPIYNAHLKSYGIMSFFGVIPADVIKSCIYKFLSLSDLKTLDKSILDRATRIYLLESFLAFPLPTYNVLMSNSDLEWIILRKVKVDKLEIGWKVTNTTVSLIRQLSSCCSCAVVLTGSADPIKPTSNKLLKRNLIISVKTRRCLHISNAIALSLISNGSRLQEVNLSGSNIKDKVLFELAKESPLLRVLDVSDCESISEKGLIAVTKSCPGLEELRFKYAFVNMNGYIRRNRNNAVLSSVALHCQQMRRILCHDISNNSIAALAQSCSNLVEFYFSGSTCDDAGLSLLAQHFPGLEKIRIDRNVFLSHDAMVIAFQSWRGLVDVELCCMNVRDDTIVALVQSCPLLKSISMHSDCSITNVALHAIADHFSGLSKLIFQDRGDYKFKVEDLVYVVSRCTALEELGMGCVMFNDAVLKLVAENLHRLKCLRLKYHYNKNIFSKATLMSLATNCKLLEEVGEVKSYYTMNPLGKAFLDLRPDVRISDSDV